MKSHYSLPEGNSAAHVAELIGLGLGFGLGVRGLGPEQPVPGPLLGLLLLTVPESDQSV